jgi:hypothetical protein
MALKKGSKVPVPKQVQKRYKQDQKRYQRQIQKFSDCADIGSAPEGPKAA